MKETTKRLLLIVIPIVLIVSILGGVGGYWYKGWVEKRETKIFVSSFEKAVRTSRKGNVHNPEVRDDLSPRERLLLYLKSKKRTITRKEFFVEAKEFFQRSIEEAAEIPAPSEQMRKIKRDYMRYLETSVEGLGEDIESARTWSSEQSFFTSAARAKYNQARVFSDTAFDNLIVLMKDYPSLFDDKDIYRFKVYKGESLGLRPTPDPK